ncbi:hypothetical protein [Aeromonas enteropelogenes]|uniref:hypothetical protein n=1 Tax=Aeromonas enteropelogenes TaxID=29489 RepID=UPI003BA289EE
MTKFFYLDKHDLARGYPCVKYVSDARIALSDQDDAQLCLYQGEHLPERLILDDTGEVREPTPQECYDLAQRIGQPYTLPAGMYVKDGRVKDIPERPATLLAPHFDSDAEAWIETASNEQLAARSDRMKKWAYLDELNRYNYARAEYELGLVSDTDITAATAYITALAGGDDSSPRPALFDRYSV